MTHTHKSVLQQINPQVQQAGNALKEPKSRQKTGKLFVIRSDQCKPLLVNGVIATQVDGVHQVDDWTGIDTQLEVDLKWKVNALK